MDNSILSGGGWSPILDVFVEEQGLATAAVFGVIWRHCQMRDNVCKASAETMGRKVGLTGRYVRTQIKKLCALGYIRDLTPDVKGQPHWYVVTPQAHWRVTDWLAAQG